VFLKADDASVIGGKAILIRALATDTVLIGTVCGGKNLSANIRFDFKIAAISTDHFTSFGYNMDWNNFCRN